MVYFLKLSISIKSFELITKVVYKKNMKFFSFSNKKQVKNVRSRRVLTDYYQESINNYGKKQLKSLIDKGISVQW